MEFSAEDRKDPQLATPLPKSGTQTPVMATAIVDTEMTDTKDAAIAAPGMQAASVHDTEQQQSRRQEEGLMEGTPGDRPADEAIVEKRSREEDEVEERRKAILKKAKELAVPDVQRIVKKGSRKEVREAYGVDADSGNLLNFHRRKLRHLLKALVQQEKWHLAAGVLSVLLGIPYLNLTNPQNMEGCWSDLGAALQVLQRLDRPGKIENMFGLIRMQLHDPRTRGLLDQQVAHFFTSINDKDSAYNYLRPIVDGKHYREDPEANLSLGLTSYALWYENATEEMARMEAREKEARMRERRHSTAEETGEYDPSGGFAADVWPLSQRSFGLAESQGSRGFGLTESQGSRGFSQPDFVFDRSGGGPDMAHQRNAPYIDSQASQKSIYEDEQDQGGEEFWRNVFVRSSQDLHPQLFPIRVPRELLQKQYTVPTVDGGTRDRRVTAIKHLKQALTFAPHMIAALLPLVQLLLAEHDVKGALDEVDKSIQALDGHFIPLSIKMAILESLNTRDPAQLATGYRDAFRSNPESLSSLEGLMKLYDSGDVEMDVLLESICLHLDVAASDIHSWQRLSSLLLAVKSQHESQPGLDDVEMMTEEGASAPSREQVQKLFSGRERWWLKRHFGIGDKWQIGNPTFIAYKAACAAHIHGPNSEFVRKARDLLEDHPHELQLLERHCERSLTLFENSSSTG